MKHRIISLILMLSSISTICSAKSANIITDTIPVTIDQDFVIVNASVNGKRKRLIFDTGSSNLTMMKTNKDDTKIEGYQTATDNNQKKGETGYTFINLQLGKFTIRQYIYLLPENKVFHQFCDGTLGLTTFRMIKAIVKLDIKKKIMIITTDKKLFANERINKTHYKLNENGLPIISLCIGPNYKVKNVALDTGNNRLLVINPTDYEKIIKSKDSEKFKKQILYTIREHIPYSIFEDNDSITSVKLRLNRLEALKLSLKNVKVVSEKQERSSLGGPVSNYGSIIFDPCKKDIYVQPYN